jgi:hypothetical protein
LLQIVDELDPGSHDVSASKGPRQSAGNAPPRPGHAVEPSHHRAGFTACKRIGPIVREAVERGFERHAREAERSHILPISKHMTIDRLLSRVLCIERRPERGGGHDTPPVSERSGHGQSFEVQAAVQLSDALAIETLSDAAVGRRRIECWKQETSDSITSFERG